MINQLDKNIKKENLFQSAERKDLTRYGGLYKNLKISVKVLDYIVVFGGMAILALIFFAAIL
jgi:hypothetical protein